MSAVLVKGIIISLSLAAAVGIALQSPEVKEWLEDQRRRLAELLRTMSEGLDPQTRREAEAFAFEGRMPTTRERAGMEDATTVATGREGDQSVISRRMNRQSSSNPIDAEERRRLGREYLARRNQELLDIQLKKDAGKPCEVDMSTQQETGIVLGGSSGSLRSTTGSAGSFEHLINDDGSLPADEKRRSMVSEVSTELPSYQPAQQAAPVAIRGAEAGATFANPFADEFAMSDVTLADRSETPRPPIPPKIALGREIPVTMTTEPEAISEDPPLSTLQPTPVASTQELSYDEQLARALSLSLAESEATAQRTLRRTLTEQEAFELAIQESLKAEPKAPEVREDETMPPSQGPLVDLSSDVTAAKNSTNPYRHQRSEDEDLYTLTPMVTGVHSRATSDGSPFPRSPAQYPDMAQFLAAFQGPSESLTKYDFPQVPTDLPAIRTPEAQLPPVQPEQPISPTSATLSPSLPPQDALSTGYHSESETDDFASLPDSTAQSEASIVEVEDVDVESMSDDDGIATPQSWSEVGSEVDESERSESEAGDMVHV